MPSINLEGILYPENITVIPDLIRNPDRKKNKENVFCLFSFLDPLFKPEDDRGEDSR